MRIFRALLDLVLPAGSRMDRTCGRAVGLLGAAVLLCVAVDDAEGAPKYFIKIRDTELAAGIDGKMPNEAPAAATPAAKVEASVGVPPASESATATTTATTTATSTVMATTTSATTTA